MTNRTSQLVGFLNEAHISNFYSEIMENNTSLTLAQLDTD